MTRTKLDACRDPETNLFEIADADERVAFAVAHRTGVAQDHTAQTEREALAVLYLTADGEQAVERWVWAAGEQFERVDRAIVAPADALEPTDARTKRFAPIVREHPET